MPLTLLQITDAHLFADPGGRLKGVRTDDSLARVVAEARRRWPRVDAILATGDLAQDGSAAAYRRFLDQLAAWDAPVLCLPGNHDRAATLFEAAGEPSRSRRLVLGNWDLLALDSAQAGSPAGHLDPAEFGRLSGWLSADDGRHRLLCIHHPPHAIGSRWLDTMRIDNGDALLGRCGDPRLKALVFGHVHQVDDRLLGGLRLLGAPATCFQFLPGSDDFALDPVPPGYRWLRLHEDGRIDTGVERVDALPEGLDLSPEGY